jgi:hypothetical protein
MDYFAHGLWSYVFFNKTSKPWIAVLFGLLPDSLSWGIYFFYNIFLNGLTFGKPDVNVVPEWVFTLYGVSHSLIVSSLVCIIIVGLVYYFTKKIFWYVLAWPIAVILDILTHTREFLPTPFLWPISTWAFPGISWGTLWFFTLNWSLIIVSLVYILGKKKNWLKKFIVKKF